MSLYVNFSLTLYLPRDPPYVPGAVSRGIQRSATVCLQLMPRLSTRGAVPAPDLRVHGIVLYIMDREISTSPFPSTFIRGAPKMLRQSSRVNCSCQNKERVQLNVYYEMGGF